jgi:UDP-N-acetylglucosamine 2-epimerase
MDSTLAAGGVGSKSNAMLAHLEAGLRSFNRSMPEITTV